MALRGRSVTCYGCGCNNDRYQLNQGYCKKCHAKYMRENRPKHSQLTDIQRKKANARAYAHVYLKRGKIKKLNCEECDSPNSQMHHDDYNKPVEVRWFCRRHHLDLHEEEYKK